MSPDTTRFSPRGFAVAVVTVGVGAAAGLAFGPVAGTYLGLFVGGFAAGLLVEDRPLVEAGVAGVLASLGVLLAGPLVGNGVVAAVLALGSVAPTTLGVSVLLGFAVGALGANFGDDLRDGLTAPVEEGDPSPTVFESTGNRLTATEGEQVDDESGGGRPESPRTDQQSNDSERGRASEKSGGDRSPGTDAGDRELEREK